MAAECHRARERGRTGKRLAALADFFLGYTVAEEPERGWCHGPQPYEGILSVICESFHCLPGPGSAQEQHWPTVRAILDYRLAEAAIEAFDDLKHGMQTLDRRPEYMGMLRAMVRAQTGADEAGADAALAGIRAARQREQDDGE